MCSGSYKHTDIGCVHVKKTVEKTSGFKQLKKFFNRLKKDFNRLKFLLTSQKWDLAKIPVFFHEILAESHF